MQVVQIRLEDSLVKQLDALVAEEKSSRAKLASKALRALIKEAEDRRKDRETIEAYKKQPVTEEEQLDWDQEVNWPEWEEAKWKGEKSAGSASKRPTKKGQSSSSRARRSSRT